MDPGRALTGALDPAVLGTGSGGEATAALCHRSLFTFRRFGYLSAEMLPQIWFAPGF